MIQLMQVELTRLRWRRAVLSLTAAAVLIPAIVFAAVCWNTRPVSEADQQRVEQQIERDSQQPSVQRDLEQCISHPGQWGVRGRDDIEQACADQILPRAEWYAERAPLDLRLESREGSGVALIVVLGILMLLAGTTFVGHDWNSGSMSNQLLFEPRRSRVWTSKALIVLAYGLVVSGLVLTAYWTGMYAVASARDINLAPGEVSALYTQVLRGTLLAGGAAVGGYALTMLLRSTVATLGILFAVSIAAPLLLSLLAFPGHQRLMPHNNGIALINDGITVTDFSDPECFDGPAEGAGCVTTVTRRDGAIFFGALLLVVGVPSLLLFRRRDVP
jgi:ABC-2 type transport system permease protein